jgi:hypothetical protein
VVWKTLILWLSLRRPLSLGGCNAVEEFLACGMWPLGKKFGFTVETQESPMSKVMVPMPQVTAGIEA